MFKVVHFSYLMYLTSFTKCVLKYISLIQFIVLSTPRIAQQAALKKVQVVKEYLLTDIDILLMEEKSISGRYIMLFIDMKKLVINT